MTAWLDTNGYLVSDAMAPALADYVGEGMSFLGVKLVGDAEVSDIAPLSITWPGDEPMIPLRLTQLSAEPEMGLFVFIAADEAYGSTNWTTMELDVDRLQWNPVRGQSNYHGLLSFQIDEVGGQGFVLERAERLDQSDWPPGLLPTEELLRLGLEYDVVTRLHARAHPEEMLTDPVFGPMDLDFDGVFDLSDRPQLERCDGARDAPLPCAETYCGVGGACAETSRLEGCVCDAGFVARLVRRAPRPGTPEASTVVCQEDSLDFLAELGPSPEEVCPSEGCGPNGECVVVNGFPTCACDAGFAAVPTFDFLTCSEVTKTWPRDRIVSWTNTTCTGCAQDARGAPSAAVLLLFVGLARRRSRTTETPVTEP